MAKNQGLRATALYERLSKDDELQGESNSISNQKKYLEDYARTHEFRKIQHYTDEYNQRMIQHNGGSTRHKHEKRLSRVGFSSPRVAFLRLLRFHDCRGYGVAYTPVAVSVHPCVYS